MSGGCDLEEGAGKKAEEIETRPEVQRKRGPVSPERKRDREFLVVLFALIGAYIALFLTLSLLRYANFTASSFDSAIFSQTIWLLSKFKAPFSTIRGMNLFGDHMAPMLFFMVPLYWIKGNIPALLTVQTIAIGLGALPLYLLARDKLESRGLALAIGAAFLIYPALEHMNLFDFHPETIGLTLLLFAFLAIDRKHTGWFYVCCIGAAFCKEDMALAVLVLGILVYFLYDKRAGKIVTIGSALYFLVTVFILIPKLGPAGYQYSGRLEQFGNTPLEAAKNFFLHPLRTLNILATRENLRYIFDLLLPVAFLSLFAPVYLLPAIPAFVINMISSFQYQHTILSQYTAGIIPFIFIALVFGLRRVKNWADGSFRPKLVLGSLAAVIVLCSLAANFYYSPSPLSGNWNTRLYTSDRHVDIVREGLSKIPEDAPVSAQVFLLAKLSKREKLYMFPNPFIDYVDEKYYDSLDVGMKRIIWPELFRRRQNGVHPSRYPIPEVTYVALDRSTSVWPTVDEQYMKVVKRLEERDNFRPIFDRDGVVILKKSGVP
jgi:uncharacterized membrane protein